MRRRVDEFRQSFDREGLRESGGAKNNYTG